MASAPDIAGSTIEERRTYPQDVDGTYPMANRDLHTMYVGEIVDAYIIKYRP